MTTVARITAAVALAAFFAGVAFLLLAYSVLSVAITLIIAGIATLVMFFFGAFGILMGQMVTEIMSSSKRSS